MNIMARRPACMFVAATRETGNALIQIVSEVDLHEVSTRFDFKGSDPRVEHSDAGLVLHADDEFQVRVTEKT